MPFTAPASINSLHYAAFTNHHPIPTHIFCATDMAKLHLAVFFFFFFFFILSMFSYFLDVSALSLTVKLYTQDSLRLSPFKNNRYSTLARLKRNSARVSSTVISGKPLHSYEYFARFGIGTPAKPFYTAVDTGTDITWIQCLCNQNHQNSCYSQTDPFFEPSKSSSYKRLSCDAPKCRELPGSYHDDNCTASAECNYQVLYGDNSTTAGGLATETFKSGSAVVNDVAIGCGHNNQGKFNGSAGILALGLGSLSFPNQIKATSFSYCLVHYNSTRAHSTLSFGTRIPSDAIQIPFLHNLKENTYYVLSLTNISVGKTIFPMPVVYGARGLRLAVDSGTFLTYLPPSLYKEIHDEFVKGVHLPSVKETAYLETCFRTTSGATESLPKIAFHFHDKILELPEETYLLQVGTHTACFTFAATDNSIAILGSQQQQGTEVSFDLVNSLVGFSKHRC